MHYSAKENEFTHKNIFILAENKLEFAYLHVSRV